MKASMYFTALLFFLYNSGASAQNDTSFRNKNFVQLTIKSKDTVIFNPCDAVNRTLFITKDSVYDNQGQEKIVLKITKTENLDSAMILHTSLADYKLIYFDTSKGIVKWNIKYKSVKYPVKILFVQKEKSGGFKIINQPCKECWGSDCEERKKIN